MDNSRENSNLDKTDSVEDLMIEQALLESLFGTSQQLAELIEAEDAGLEDYQRFVEIVEPSVTNLINWTPSSEVLRQNMEDDLHRLQYAPEEPEVGLDEWNSETILQQQPPIPSDESLVPQPPSIPSDESFLQQPPSVPSDESFLQQPPSVPSDESFLPQPPSVPSDESFLQQPPSVSSDESLLQHPPSTPSSGSMMSYYDPNDELPLKEAPPHKIPSQDYSDLAFNHAYDDEEFFRRSELRSLKASQRKTGRTITFREKRTSQPRPLYSYPYPYPRIIPVSQQRKYSTIMEREMGRLKPQPRNPYLPTLPELETFKPRPKRIPFPIPVDKKSFKEFYIPTPYKFPDSIWDSDSEIDLTKRTSRLTLAHFLNERPKWMTDTKRKTIRARSPPAQRPTTPFYEDSRYSSDQDDDQFV